ncbi:hypothetical protein [Mycolicibacterium psychrotolerans]|uniref:Uncharacterized protein n=1 Tax=Mycolicibacterium psychrotolerans TaxID=216929 RepID=A0A7I7M4W0_9MYCO|nr:hypothetical protein [Mycolicibacterium psychrotolerans]BBX66583.1 hypothetical protein MPSYJ_00440 [Mycolicibacterium psychrotolerans]
MTAAELLAQAQHILARRAVRGSSSRTAAFLARRALEEIIDDRCDALDASAPSANTRSKLLVLKALDPDVGDTASMVWNRLSRACHVHAYELQPSVLEVQHLCHLLSEMLARTDG